MEFRERIKAMILAHFQGGKFGNFPEIMKEVKYFLHYTLLILDDDHAWAMAALEREGIKDAHFFKTAALLTRFDEYVFSARRQDPLLRDNIVKISALAHSRRFDDEPKQN